MFPPSEFSVQDFRFGMLQSYYASIFFLTILYRFLWNSQSPDNEWSIVSIIHKKLCIRYSPSQSSLIRTTRIVRYLLLFRRPRKRIPILFHNSHLSLIFHLFLQIPSSHSPNSPSNSPDNFFVRFLTWMFDIYQPSLRMLAPSSKENLSRSGTFLFTHDWEVGAHSCAVCASKTGTALHFII